MFKMLPGAAVIVAVAIVPHALSQRAWAQDTESQAAPDPLTEAMQPISPKIPAEVPVLPALQGEPLPITLGEVILRTLEQNLAIQINRIDRDIAAAQVFGEYGIYDPVFTTRVTHTQTDEQSPSTLGSSVANFGAPGVVGSAPVELESPTVTGRESTLAEALLSQRTPLGGVVELRATDERVENANPSAFSQLSPYYQQTAALRLTQPLLRNAGTLVTNAPIRIAKRRLEQSNLDFRQELQDRLSEVMRAYWELVFNLRNLQVQILALESARELERTSGARVEVGSSPRLDLYQAQAQVAQREAAILRAEADVVASMDELRRLMNWDRQDIALEWDRPLLPQEPLVFDPNLTLDEPALLNLAYDSRPDYQIANLERDIAGINRDVSRRQRLPELDVFGEYGYSGLAREHGDAYDELNDFDYAGYSVGGEFRYPLFNRSARARYMQDRYRYTRADLSLEQLEVEITTEVREAVRQIRTSLAQVRANQRQVEADEERVRTQRLRFDEGEATNFELLEAEDDLAESRAALARALVNYQQGLIQLGRNTGMILAQLGIAVDDQEAPGGWDLGFRPDSASPVAPPDNVNLDLRPSAEFAP